MDPLLEHLQSFEGYHIDDYLAMSSVAFADDLLLMVDTRGARRLLLHTEHYLLDLGMKVAAPKAPRLKLRPPKARGIKVIPTSI